MTPRLAWAEPAPQTLAEADWRESAACRDLGPGRFYPDGATPHAPLDFREARVVCRECPVRAQCAAAGSGEDFGMWGGQSPLDRNRRPRRQGGFKARTRANVTGGVTP